MRISLLLACSGSEMEGSRGGKGVGPLILHKKTSETKKAETISRVLFTSVSTFHFKGKSAYKPSVPSGQNLFWFL